MKLQGKEAIDKLFEDEWEVVCNVLWDYPERVEMDKDTRKYFERKIEHAIWLFQNVELLRGGKPNPYWFEADADPSEFWAEWDRWEAGFANFIDPEIARWEKMREEMEGKDK